MNTEGSTVEKRSLYREAAGQVRRFAGEDPDARDRAASEWNRKHWWNWSRKRWIEHIKGEVFWIELGEQDFGMIREDLERNRSIAPEILRKINDGEENLDIINWALDQGEDIDEVLAVLAKLDLNKSRLEIRSAMS